MHALIEELLQSPNVYEETDYQSYFEDIRAGDPEYGLSTDDIDSLEYTLSYADELLIGVDFDSRRLIFIGDLNWELQKFMPDSDYDTDEKFKSLVQTIKDVLLKNYVNIGSTLITSYDPHSDKIYRLDIDEHVFKLSKRDPEEYESNYIIDSPVGKYGSDLGSLDVIFESGFGEWNTRNYVFKNGAIKVASRVNQGAVDMVSSEFTPLVCEEHWVEYIRLLANDEQNEVVYTDEDSRSELTSSII